MVGDEIMSTDRLWHNVEKVLVSRDEIALRVASLAGEIAAVYDGRELTILPVLTGSLIFTSDLIRRLPLPMRIDLISISSYPDGTLESSSPKFNLPIPADLSGRDILIVDDILDSGRTLASLAAALERRKPASVRSCVLLRKLVAGRKPLAGADFVGFDVPDEFVVGYGLDFKHLYRNLPDICVLKAHAKGGAS